MFRLFLISLTICFNTVIFADAQNQISNNEDACDHGDGKACFTVAVEYFNGKSVKKSVSKSLELFEKSCKHNNLNGCMNAAIFYEKGRGAKRNINKAIKYYDIS